MIRFPTVINKKLVDIRNRAIKEHNYKLILAINDILAEREQISKTFIHNAKRSN